MRCKCGYGFSEVASRGKGGFESFAAIRDSEYREFLESEVAVLGSQDGPPRTIAIARSSRYVGTALEYPVCNRLVLVPPGGGPIASHYME